MLRKSLFAASLTLALSIAAATAYAPTATAQASTHPAAAAQSQISPVGRWRSIDDASGKPKAVIEIVESNGSLSAKIVEILDTKDGPNPLCKECKGSRHNQPIRGMTIAWGLKPQGDIWGSGRILDPENGKEYSVKMTPIAGGRKLEVRGFLGLSLLGRTQVWLRE